MPLNTMTVLHTRKMVALLLLSLTLVGLSCHAVVGQTRLAPLIDLSGPFPEPAMPTNAVVPDTVAHVKSPQIAPMDSLDPSFEPTMPKKTGVQDPVSHGKARQLTPQTLPKTPRKIPVVSFEELAFDLKAVDEKEAAGFRALEESIRLLDGSLRQQRSQIRLERKKTQLAIRAADELIKRMLQEERCTEKNKPPATTPQPKTAPTPPTATTPENTDPPADVTSPEGPPLSQDDDVLLEGTLRAITTQEVDRWALADNLFAAGKYAVSLKVYERLLPDTTMPRDMAWLHLQIGSIYRNAKNYEESEKHYRMVTGLGPDTPYYEYARWWLVTLKQRMAWESKTQRLRTTIADIRGGKR